MSRRDRRARLAVLTVLPLILALVLAGCGEIDPRADRRFAPGAAPEGRILFVQDGDVHLWDGEVRRITNLGDASSPAWANDGQRFVFVRTGYAISDLWLADINSDDLVMLTDNQPPLQMGTEAYVRNAVWALDPVWSPVDDTIAYASDRGTLRNFLWLLPGPGSAPVRVEGTVLANENIEGPDFSPDGTRIAYTQRTTGDWDNQRWTEIWVVDLNTGVAQPLIQSPEGSYDPAWSPDGRWIAYVQREGRHNDLWVMPAEGGTPLRLTEGRSLVSPVWSPDGRNIAFLEEAGGSFAVAYVQFTVPEQGAPFASKPSRLFAAGRIHAPSGLSWAP